MNIITIVIMTISLTTWIILSSNNPINLVLWIILLTILSSIIIALTISSWFALILLLIYIGGIIVIFSYFVRLRSNDSIISKSNLHFLILPVVIIERTNLQIFYPLYNKSHVNQLYLDKNTTILLFITITLLLIIIIVTMAVKKDNGPLRGFNRL